jgi:hypothetical protein
MLNVMDWLRRKAEQSVMEQEEPMLPCTLLMHLFYGPDIDGRSEPARDQREQLAKALCATCEQRVPCLRRAVRNRENLGVQGGMGEGERRAYLQHLKDEGYENCPEDDVELYASLREFYQKHEGRYIHTLELDVMAEWEAYHWMLESE